MKLILILSVLVLAIGVTNMLHRIDWLKAANVLQALLTPVIAIATLVLYFVTVRIQRKQTEAADGDSAGTSFNQYPAISPVV